MVVVGSHRLVSFRNVQVACHTHSALDETMMDERIAMMFADPDFDDLLGHLWNRHLSTLPESSSLLTVGGYRRPLWGSTYWRDWMAKVVLPSDYDSIPKHQPIKHPMVAASNDERKPDHAHPTCS